MSLGHVAVDDTEGLARMILVRKHLRLDKIPHTPKPEAFLPYSRVELSVIRKRDISEDELWAIGHQVRVMREEGDQHGRKFPLQGRCDILARDVRDLRLDVLPLEGHNLPKNHANIIGWPADRSAQMMQSVQLAAKATFIPVA